MKGEAQTEKTGPDRPAGGLMRGYTLSEAVKMPQHGDIYNCYNRFLGIVTQPCVTPSSRQRA